MRILACIVGLSVLLPALGIAAPSQQPTDSPEIKVRAASCTPSSYNKTEFKLDFEDLGPYCPHYCPPYTRFNLTSPRGQGYAFTQYAILEKPLMIGNVYQWQGLNCESTEISGKDESYACVANSTRRALYSPGKSPYDPNIKPRLGSVDFPRDYMTWDVQSFWFTPIGLPANAKKVRLELKGIREDGSEVKEFVNLENTKKKKTFQVTRLDRKGFTQLKVLEFWLVADRKEGYAFAIDDLVGTEYRATSPLPESCNPPPITIDNCGSPKTLDFDDIPVRSSPTIAPAVYKGFRINPPWVVISKKNYNKGTPGYIAPVSPNNALWSGGSNVSGSLDAYVSPAQYFLWSFESATFTIDLPEYATNTTLIKDVQLDVWVSHSCGNGISAYAKPYPLGWVMTPDKLQFTFAKPIIAISQLWVSATLTSQNNRRIEVFVDNLKYRKYDGPVPGCRRCGGHGSKWCEIPSLVRGE